MSRRGRSSVRDRKILIRKKSLQENLILFSDGTHILSSLLRLEFYLEVPRFYNLNFDNLKTKNLFIFTKI